MKQYARKYGAYLGYGRESRGELQNALSAVHLRLQSPRVRQSLKNYVTRLSLSLKIVRILVMKNKFVVRENLSR